MKKTQFGESVTGDFEKGEWIFEMENKDFQLYTGKFAIVPIEKYKEEKMTIPEEIRRFKIVLADKVIRELHLNSNNQFEWRHQNANHDIIKLINIIKTMEEK